LTGRIVDSEGQAITDAVFDLLNADSLIYFGSQDRYKALPPKLALEADRFQLTGLQSSHSAYYRISSPDGTLSALHGFSATDVNTTPTITLRPNCQIRGRVTLNGQPMVGQSVEFHLSIPTG
jgi:hypothetical protein